VNIGAHRPVASGEDRFRTEGGLLQDLVAPARELGRSSAKDRSAPPGARRFALAGLEIEQRRRSRTAPAASSARSDRPPPAQRLERHGEPFGQRRRPKPCDGRSTATASRRRSRRRRATPRSPGRRPARPRRGGRGLRARRDGVPVMAAPAGAALQ
jgi:hypothetical protein